MKNSYNLLILNNCPSFYKINLYNEINKKRKIFVVFLGLSDQVVIEENFKELIQFDYYILHNFQLEKRNFFSSIISFFRLISKIKFEKIIYGGYIEPEFLILSFLSKKSKNILQTESAFEAKTVGLKMVIKKILLSRYKYAIVSGRRHKEVLLDIGFSGDIRVSKGVGIIKKQEPIKKNANNPLRFLFIGRLIKIKNVERIINVFNSNKLPLTIVGIGEQIDFLKSIAHDNITFEGFIDNERINNYYNSHDVFILPSLIEPWGLVVEEALHFGCPILLSENVGSLPELLEDYNTGVRFNPNDERDIQNAIEKMISNFDFFAQNVKQFDIEKRDLHQINSYLF